MKTPMQELLEWVRATQPLPSINTRMIIQEIQSLLEKEKEAIMNAYDIGWSDGNKDQDLNDLYYFETFNAKEK